MLACTLDSVVSKLFDTNGFGDIRLEMLSFVRKKTPDIGGENIVLSIHIRKDGEDAAGIGTVTGASAPAETPVRGKIIEA